MMDKPIFANILTLGSIVFAVEMRFLLIRCDVTRFCSRGMFVFQE